MHAPSQKQHLQIASSEKSMVQTGMGAKSFLQVEKGPTVNSHDNEYVAPLWRKKDTFSFLFELHHHI